MQITRKVSVLAVSLLGVAGLGTGVALAQSGTTTVPKGPAVTSPAPAAPSQEKSAAAENAPEKVEPAAAENAPEQVEPGEANLPGGGHADTGGQNVDHQFEGVE